MTKYLKIRIFLLAVVTLSYFSSNAQNEKGYTVSFFGIGQSFASNSKLATINIEGTSTSKLKIGFAAQVLFYNPNVNYSNFFKVQDKFYNAGLYLKLNLSTTRNFANDFKIGGFAGTNGHSIIYYPYGELTQTFWLSPKTRLIIGENAAYLFNAKKEEQFQKRWMPSLNVGMGFKL